MYALQRVKIHIVKIHSVKRLTLKHFNVKSYYFVFCTSIKITAYHCPSTLSHKNSNLNIFSQTQLTLQHKARLFSLQLLTYWSTIGASFSHICLMVIERFTLFTTQCCLNNWFKELSTCVTLLQSLVLQLIGTNKQSIKCS